MHVSCTTLWKVNLLSSQADNA
jgi:hypothetical protein